MAAATKNGSRGPPRAARPPMAGPITNPTPYAAPRSPKHPRPFLGADEVGRRRLRHGHAPARCTVEDAGHATGARASPATPVRKLAPAVPARDTMSSGLRPTAIGKSPEQRRAHANWAAENAASRSPIDAGPRPEPVRVQREEGDDDAEAEEVDGDRGPQHSEPRWKSVPPGTGTGKRGAP